VKKQKVVRLEPEQQNKLDLNAIHELQEGLNKVDSFPLYTPDLQWFEHMVLAEKQKLRKKLVKDLSIFMMIAICILTGIVVSLYQMPIIFIFLQVFTTLFIILYTGTRIGKKVNSE
jgi:Flp pilus assembly protein TadB